MVVYEGPKLTSSASRKERLTKKCVTWTKKCVTWMKKMFKLDFENVKCKPRGIKYGKIHLGCYNPLSSRYFSTGSEFCIYNIHEENKSNTWVKKTVFRSGKDPLLKIENDQQFNNLLFNVALKKYTLFMMKGIPF